MWALLSVRVGCNLGRDCCFTGAPNSSGSEFYLDRVLRVEDTKDRNLKFRDHFAEFMFKIDIRPGSPGAGAGRRGVSTTIGHCIVILRDRYGASRRGCQFAPTYTNFVLYVPAGID
jgi:hypothetical protein